MVPGHHHSRGPPSFTTRNDFTTKLPPSWCPEHERTYSFRRYMADLQLWIMVTDLAPHAQAAAIVMRLEGAASELARSFTTDQLMRGDQVQGQPVDPVTFVIATLQDKLGQLEEGKPLNRHDRALGF